MVCVLKKSIRILAVAALLFGGSVFAKNEPSRNKVVMALNDYIGAVAACTKELGEEIPRDVVEDSLTNVSEQAGHAYWSRQCDFSGLIESDNYLYDWRLAKLKRKDRLDLASSYTLEGWKELSVECRLWALEALGLVVIKPSVPEEVSSTFAEEEVSDSSDS